jgi:predicted nucleic acid-binding protein
LRYWDSSAVVPLLVQEESTAAVKALLQAEQDMLSWWGTDVECASALARLEREGGMDPPDVGRALRRLSELRRAWHEIQPSDSLRETAIRLLRVHDLRAADALQLAAAVVASAGRPSALPFVCLDERLTQAAEREGFRVLPEDGDE